MKRVNGLLLIILVLLPTGSAAQQPAATAYLLLRPEKIDVVARLDLHEHKVQVRATLTVSNPSPRPVATMRFKLGQTAEITGATIDGVARPFETKTNEENQTVSVNFELDRPLAPGRSTTVVLDYGFPVPQASARAALTIDEWLLLPESFWIPVIHTPYLIDYNVDTAPFTLRIEAPTGMKVISSGELVSEERHDDMTWTTYRQRLFARPMFIARDFERVGEGGGAVEIYQPRGYALANAKTIDQLRSEAERILNFYTGFFGQPAPTPIRIVASARVPFYGAPGILVVDERTLAREILDEETVYFLASNLARNWLGGRYRITGPGHGVLFDGLPSFLALLYMRRQYGPSVAERMVTRFRTEYLAIVRGGSAYDAPLARQSLRNRQYFRSIYNKVPMVMRLIEKSLGEERFLSIIKALFSGEAGRTVTLADFRRAVLAAGGAKKLEPILERWFDRVVLPDFAVGKPVYENGKWSVTVANFGDGGGDVDVEIETEDGRRLRQTVKIEAQGYAQAAFQTSSPPRRARVDPDQLYIQAKYENDVYPRKPPVAKLMGEGTLALIRGDAAQAEAAFRQVLAGEPENAAARALWARALAALDRLDEAEREAHRALAESLPSLAVFAHARWALADVAMKRHRPADAIAHYRQAALALAEDVALLAARDALIGAERAAGKLPLPGEPVRGFIARLDAAIGSGRPAAVKELVEMQNLKSFAVGVAFLEGWKTEILRGAPLDAHRMILDVKTLATTSEGQRRARAIYILRQQGSSWKLYEIPVFVEK
ncbi:MAG: hypothetical protein D6723_12700 [Acidobacteria bacterium]|nr:MAG: hypothetical protein D6723_12700 [Acidobacteriota bacterium]